LPEQVLLLPQQNQHPAAQMHPAPIRQQTPQAPPPQRSGAHPSFPAPQMQAGPLLSPQFGPVTKAVRSLRLFWPRHTSGNA
jgi:hypothetical protein